VSQVKEPLLRVRDLAVHFPVRRGFWQRRVGTLKAVDGVSFDIAPGETLGLVGESGSGKSTLARALVRLTPTSAGEALLGGRNLFTLSPAELIRARREIQMIFQDPYASLDPRMTVLDIVAEPLLLHERYRSRREAAAEVLRLLETVGLEEDAMRRYPHEFSGGQRQRIGIARAIALEPKLIIADEPVSALDVSIQAQVVNLLASLQKERGLSYLFIAHDLGVVRYLSHSVAVMYLGKIVERAGTEELFEAPGHPYTRALLAAVPAPDPRQKKRRLVLAGEMPSPLSPPLGCPFHPRCPEVMDRCRTDAPLLRERRPGRWVACHLEEPPPRSGGVA